ncbi:MAG: SURF1 family protein [Actinomycetota bacterium]|nr:SURF1 family protein [Actinomycetota bacterium]
MTGWRFALTRRWLGYLALTVAFAVACVLLSQWQWARNAERAKEIERVEQNYDRDPVELGAVLEAPDAFDAAEEWMPVRMTGTYLAEEQLLVRNRPLNGAPGFEVLTPLLLEDGSVFVVDRGWLPTGSDQDLPDEIPEPPAGTVTVVAHLKPGEPPIPGRSAPDGQIATVHLDDIAERLDRAVYTGAYGLLASEDPAPAVAPRTAERPEADPGPHLSYALQWVLFGLLAFVALVWAVRQEYRARNADTPEQRRRAEQRAKRNAARRSDDEEEDAILDLTHR